MKKKKKSAIKISRNKKNKLSPNWPEGLRGKIYLVRNTPNYLVAIKASLSKIYFSIMKSGNLVDHLIF